MTTEQERLMSEMFGLPHSGVEFQSQREAFSRIWAEAKREGRQEGLKEAIFAVHEFKIDVRNEMAEITAATIVSMLREIANGAR